jgi:hypothetical protein
VKVPKEEEEGKRKKRKRERERVKDGIVRDSPILWTEANSGSQSLSWSWTAE